MSDNKSKKIGIKGELIALNTLEGSVFVGRPTDIDWDGQRIEVKTSRKRHPKLRSYATGEWLVGKTFFWKFDLKRQRDRADFYLLICLDELEQVEHMFLIPVDKFNVNQLNLAESHLEDYEDFIVPISGLARLNN